MTHPNKAKGSKAELDVARYLAANWWPYAERAYGAGRPDDVGDIDGIPGVVFEVKNEKRIDMPGYLRELEVEVANAHAITGVVVVKRRLHTDPADWYAVTRFGDWCQMAKDAGL
jgi:hypothetical protein